MKYIDADKLIKLVKEWRSKQMGFAWDAVNEVLKIITSLQQDQPETDEDDGKFVKISVRKEFAEQFQRLGDEIQSGQSSFIRAVNQQEQPEVDLEKEIEEWWQNWASPPRNEYAVFDKEEFINLARHFYELARQKYEK